MAHDRSTVDAILTEHFRYTPLSVLDDIINSVNSIIYKALTALETGLLAQAPKNLGFVEPKSKSSRSASTTQAPTTAANATPAETARSEIENGTHALETLLEAAVDKNFDIFELFALQNIFSIDPSVLEHVRLQHYEDINWPLGKDDVVPETLAKMRGDLRNERELGLALERENMLLDSVLAQLRGMMADKTNGGLGILDADTSSSSTTGSAKPKQPLLTTAQFSISQLPGLQVLIRDLRAKMALLPSSPEELKGRDRPGSTGDEERKRYVEGVARRAVRENLGARTGDEMGLGPVRSVAEVEALEVLVGGRAGEGEGEEDDDGDEQED